MPSSCLRRPPRPPSSHHGFSTAKHAPDLWHQRLGHPSSPIVASILRSNKIACAPNNEQTFICDACQRGKVHQLPYNRSSHVTTSPHEIVHTDVWGPAITLVGGLKYHVSFLNDYSRFTWLYLLKHKSEVETAFYSFQKLAERSLNAKIHTVQSDWGGEYRRLNRYFTRSGIIHQVTCPHTSKQNRIVERKHRHIVETVIALLVQSSVPVCFWDEAFLAACYLINRMLSRVLQNDTPVSHLFNEKPDYSFLQVFSCACWPNLRPYNARKLSFRSRQCVFFSYNNMHNGHKCLDWCTGRVYISRDVVFGEHVFPFSVPSTPATPPASLNPPSCFPVTEPVIQDDSRTL